MGTITPAQALDYLHLVTRTNSTTLTSADVVILGRPVTDELARELLGTGENITLLNTTSNLVASTTSANRQYSLAADILNRVQAVEAMFDGSNWVKLKPLRFDEYDDTTDEDTIVGNFSNEEGEAYYSVFNKKLWIWSGTISAVTNGLKAWYHSHLKYITDMASAVEMDVDDSATSLGMPEALHETWCIGISRRWKMSKEKPIPLSEIEIAYETNLRKAIGTLKGSSQELEIFGNLPNATARWNGGYGL